MQDDSLFLLKPKSIYDTEQLKALYGNRSRVEKLDIRKCQNLIPYNFHDKAISFGRLKILSLHECNITTLQLEDFLQKCPELEEITISSCNNLDQRFSDTFKKRENSLPRLKKLAIVDCNITTHELENFLQQGPYVEELKVNSCRNLGQRFSASFIDKTDCLASLKKLTLWRSHITITELESLLQLCPNLQELSICRCENLRRGFSDTFMEKRDYFLQLKKLILFGNHMVMDGIRAFLQQCPNLEEMNISGWDDGDKKSPSYFKNGVDNFSRLKKLALRNFTLINLVDLQTRCPNLEEIELSRCKKLIFSHDGELKDFKYLKKLRLTKTNISSAMLEYLLLQCPNLEELSFYEDEDWVPRCADSDSESDDDGTSKEVFKLALQDRRLFLAKRLLLLWGEKICRGEWDKESQDYLSEFFLDRAIDEINGDSSDEEELLRLLNISISYSIKPLDLFVYQLIRDNCSKNRLKLFLKIIYHVTIPQEFSEKFGEIYLAIAMYLWGMENELSDLAVLFLRGSIIFSCDSAQNLYSQACRRLMGLPTVVLGGGERPEELFDSVSQEEPWRIEVMEYKAGILEMMLNDREWGSSLQDSYANNIEGIADLFLRKKLFLYVGEMLYKKSKNESLPLDIAIYFLRRAGNDDKQARILLWSMGRSYNANFFLPGSDIKNIQKDGEASQHRRNKSF